MKEYSIQQKLMGTAFKLGVIAKSEEEANHYLMMGVNEIRRLEILLSEFIPESATSLINKNAYHSFVPVEKECFELIERCIAISKLTKGDFDITVSPLKQLYSFKNTVFRMPAAHVISDTLKSVGYSYLELNRDKHSVKYNKPGLKISFAAIGKGFASDQVKKLWKKKGLSSGYINASGDLNAFGLKPDGSRWNIAIINPDHKDKPLFFIPLEDGSVATSGDTEQHFIWKGKRYSHNINPHTGMPLQGIKSVSVFSPAAELSDALATGVYVKGETRGIDFINQLPQSHCIIISENNTMHFSKNIEYETIKT